jgi:hypothetical protein
VVIKKFPIIALFLLGCATGGVASQFVAPPANAESATRWTYYCANTTADDMNEAMGALNEAGQKGWELVTVNSTDGFYCFKRAE